MEVRCKAGDLAVVINAFHYSNIGRIVKVLALHDGQGDLFFHERGIVWLVESAQPMTWSVYKKRYRRRPGPVPYSLPQPIGEITLGHDAALHREMSVSA